MIDFTKLTQKLDFNFKLKVYPNPMRDDGVFVWQDLPVEPYQPPNEHLIPAVPQEGFGFRHQIPLELAEELVKRWNLVQDLHDRELAEMTEQLKGAA